VRVWVIKIFPRSSSCYENDGILTRNMGVSPMLEIGTERYKLALQRFLIVHIAGTAETAVLRA
jgi:hypothetical protein